MAPKARRPDLLTRTEAAAYLGCSVSHLAHTKPADGGPACVQIGRAYLYRVADLDYYIDVVARHESSRARPEAKPMASGPSPSPTSTRARGESIAERLRRSSDEREAKGRPQ